MRSTNFLGSHLCLIVLLAFKSLFFSNFNLFRNKRKNASDGEEEGKIEEETC